MLQFLADFLRGPASHSGSLLALLMLILMVFVIFWGTVVAMMPWVAAGCGVSLAVKLWLGSRGSQ